MHHICGHADGDLYILEWGGLDFYIHLGKKMNIMGARIMVITYASGDIPLFIL